MMVFSITTHDVQLHETRLTVAPSDQWWGIYLDIIKKMNRSKLFRRNEFQCENNMNGRLHK